MSRFPNFHIPNSYEDVNPGWLVFPLIFRGKLKEKRKDLQILFQKAGLHSRRIFNGYVSEAE